MFLDASFWIRRSAANLGRFAAVALLTGMIALPPAVAQQAARQSNPQATQDLFDAVFNHNLGAAQTAVGAGADLSMRNDWGLTAIDLAVDKGYYEIVHYLLSVRNFRRQQASDEQQSAPIVPPFVAAPTPGPLPGPEQAPPAFNVQRAPLPRVGQTPATVAVPAPAAPPAPSSPGGQPNPFAAGSVTSGQPDIIGNIQGPGAPPSPRTPIAPPSPAAVPEPAAPTPRPASVSTPAPAAPPAVQARAAPVSEGPAAASQSAPAPSAPVAGGPQIPVAEPPETAAVPPLQPARPATSAVPARTTDSAVPARTTDSAVPARTTDSAVPAPAAESGGGLFSGFLNWLQGILPFGSDAEQKPVPPAAPRQPLAAAPAPAPVPAASSMPSPPAPVAALPTQPAPAAAPPAARPAEHAAAAASQRVSLRLSEDASLDRVRHGEAQGNCITKLAGATLFCIEPVTWPAPLRKAFETTTIMYQGSRAIVRYDGETATSLYAVFSPTAFDSVAAWVEGQFGPPSSATTQRLAVPGKSPVDNRIRLWRSRDPASGQETALELRSIDNVRNSFPDAEHGVVMLYREGAVAIFPQLSAIDLMMLR